MGCCTVKHWVIVGAGCTAGVILIHYASKIVRRKLKDHSNPFVPVGIVSQLYVYPVESCRGRQVNSIECAESGAKHAEIKEQQLAIVDANTGAMVTAEMYPRMVLIDCDIVDGILTLTTPESTPIRVNLHKVMEANNTTPFKICDKGRSTGLDCGPLAADWLSRTLHVVSPLKILYCKDGINRAQCIFMRCLTPFSGYQTKCARLSPYVAITHESLDDLNDNIEPDRTNATPRNLRANIVVEKCAPYDEDNWMEIKIGDAEFECFQPCIRDETVMIDAETGEVTQDKEPLKTLKKLRTQAVENPVCSHAKGNPSFGVCMSLIQSGSINIGDSVHVRYKRQAT